MRFLTDNAKSIVWIIDRVGVPLLLCAFLSWIIVVKFKQLEEGLKRCQRNQIAMMKKMGVKIPERAPTVVVN